MSKRTKFLLGIGVIATLLVGWQVAAFAVHEEDLFELEGDAVNVAAIPGDDWDSICEKATVTDDPNPPNAITDLCTGAVDASAAVEDVAFVQEPNPQASFFTGGGSKDPQDIPNWAWKNDTGGLPDKSNLTNSYAASYTATDGDELLYFGADRFDGSGDAAIAFWFLQDEVAQGTNSIGGGQGFTGEHQEGDVLVISNFSNGGNVSTITVYEWNTACGKAGDKVDLNDPPTPTTSDDNTCGAANLLILTTSTDADCESPTIPDDDSACAVVNDAGDAPNTAPWPFDNKDQGTANNASFLPGEFFEGGINLTDLGLSGQCFATALAETRTSTSPTSTLKDFTIGPFGECAAGVETQASKDDDNDPETDPVDAGTVTPGTAVFDIATITGSGTTPPIDPTGTVKFFLCGPDADLNNDVVPADPADPDAPAGCLAVANDPDTQIGTPPEGETVVGGGEDPPDGISTAQSEDVNTELDPLDPGFYCFRAEYSGDTNYDPDSHTNATTECFTVADTFSVNTEQSYIPQDKATIDTDSGDVDGTVKFELYNTQANCDLDDGTGLLYAEEVTLTEETGPVSVSTSNDGDPEDATATPPDDIAGYSVTATDAAPVVWRVTFTPSGTGITGTDSECVEESAVTIDNDNTPEPEPTP